MPFNKSVVIIIIIIIIATAIEENETELLIHTKALEVKQNNFKIRSTFRIGPPN
jgi:hypothetical protein